MRLSGVLLSASLLFSLAANAAGAEAGERKKIRRVAAPADHYYAGPDFVHRIPGLRLFFGDYALSEEEFNALYGEEDTFDESYYEPKPLVTAKPKAKPAAKSAAQSGKPTPPDVTTASLGKIPDAPVRKKALPGAKPAQANSAAAPKPVANTAEAAPSPTTSALSCGKAGTIIEGYGFSGVKPESCKGKIFAFNATRGGRTFAIKLDAASGELTEVRKLN
jgi:hypothetical protein